MSSFPCKLQGVKKSLITGNDLFVVGAVPSPMSRNQEDQAYLEKVKQLSKYIEPLRKMIARVDKDEGRNSLFEAT